MDSTVTDRSQRVAENVRTAMAAAGTSQTALAEATGIPRITLVRRLNGQASFTISELDVVATALEVSLSDLLAGVAA